MDPTTTPATEPQLQALFTAMPDPPQRHPLALAIESEGMMHFHPGTTNHHDPEWTPNAQGRCYLGVSVLVKKTAFDYAERIMLEAQDEDESMGYFGRRGGILAWDHLRRISPFRECRITVPLDAFSPALAGIDLIGHVDGIRVSGPNGENLSFARVWNPPGGIFLTPLEMKSHQSITDSNVDLAARQALLYAAMMQHSIDLDQISARSAGVWPLATFHDAEQDPHAKALPIGLLPNAKVFGASVHIDQGTEPKGFVQFIDDEALPDAVFAWAIEKATAIMTSVQAYRGAKADAFGDGSSPLPFDPAAESERAMAVPGGVLDYQKTPFGLQEFRMDISAISAGVDESELAYHALQTDAARAAITAAEAKKELHSAKSCTAIFSARTADGQFVTDKKGERVRTLTCDLGPDAELKVTAVPTAGGKSFWPKVSRKGSAWDNPETTKLIEARVTAQYRAEHPGAEA